MKDFYIDYYYNEIGYLEKVLNFSYDLSDVYIHYVVFRINYLKDFLSFDIYHSCLRFYKNLSARRKRLYKRLKLMSRNNSLLFLTLTFNNKYISYKESSLHTFVKVFLSSLNCDYVANKDYGEINNRLHYHAIVSLDHIDFSLWSYGNIDVEKVNCSNLDLSRISSYILKFVNHSFKDSTNKYIIYSKKNKNKRG